MRIKNVGVIGLGTMGEGIVQLILQKRLKAVMCDVSRDVLGNAQSTIFSRLERLYEKGRLTLEEITNGKSHLIGTTNLERILKIVI